MLATVRVRHKEPRASKATEAAFPLMASAVATSFDKAAAALLKECDSDDYPTRAHLQDGADVDPEGPNDFVEIHLGMITIP